MPRTFESDYHNEIVAEREEAVDRQRALSQVVANSSVVHWIFFIIGCAVLLPWNAIITAMPFFLSRLEKSHLQPVFASYLVASMQLVRLPALVHATYTVKQVPKTTRIRTAGTSLVVLLALLYASTLTSGLNPWVFFSFAIINGTLQSCINSYFQTALVAIASWFGPLAIQSMFSGQAAVAVIISLLQLLSAVESINKPDNGIVDTPPTGRSNVDRAATTFFFVMTAGMILALLSHTYLTRMVIYKEAAAEFEGKPPAVTRDSEETPLLHTQQNASEVTNQNLSQIQRILHIIHINWTYNSAVFLIFFVTLAVFPAITTAIVSVQPPYSTPASNPLVFTAIHFLLFNFGDWVGRWLCKFSLLQVWSGDKLLLFACLRLFFVPLFLACNIQPSISNQPLINSDLAYFVILLLFGVTNGHLGSLCMMSAPSLEHNHRITKDEVDIAAVVASFCLAGGLTAGSIANFGIRAIICGCNPFIN